MQVLTSRTPRSGWESKDWLARHLQPVGAALLADQLGVTVDIDDCTRRGRLVSCDADHYVGVVAWLNPPHDLLERCN